MRKGTRRHFSRCADFASFAYPSRPLLSYRSVEPVEAHRAAGHDLVLGRVGQPFEPLSDHGGRAGEEAVRVRVVGRPHDLMRPDIVGEHLEAALDRLERNPAIALEQFAWPYRQPRVIEALIVEMAVHAVEPRRDPAAAGFEETDADLRVLL